MIGLLGVLLLAKKRGLIASMRDTVDQLTSEAGFYLTDEVRSLALKLAGESKM